VNVTWAETIELKKTSGNVYVNATWTETIEYKAKWKWLCECYVNWNHWILSKKDLFMWLLQYVNVTWIETIKYNNGWMFMWMLHELKL
jgi:hypothetical protein